MTSVSIRGDSSAVKSSFQESFVAFCFVCTVFAWYFDSFWLIHQQCLTQIRRRRSVKQFADENNHQLSKGVNWCEDCARGGPSKVRKRNDLSFIESSKAGRSRAISQRFVNNRDHFMTLVDDRENIFLFRLLVALSRYGNSRAAWRSLAILDFSSHFLGVDFDERKKVSRFNSRV